MRTRILTLTENKTKITSTNLSLEFLSKWCWSNAFNFSISFQFMKKMKCYLPMQKKKSKVIIIFDFATCYYVYTKRYFVISVLHTWVMKKSYCVYIKTTVHSLCGCWFFFKALNMVIKLTSKLTLKYNPISGIHKKTNNIKV